MLWSKQTLGRHSGYSQAYPQAHTEPTHRLTGLPTDYIPTVGLLQVRNKGFGIFPTSISLSSFLNLPKPCSNFSGPFWQACGWVGLSVGLLGSPAGPAVGSP